MKKFVFIYLISTVFISCEKDIDLNLKEAPEQLVVEAQFTNNKDVSIIKVTKSKGLSGTFSSFEFVSDAQVKVTDDNGNTYNFHFDPNPSKLGYISTQPVLPSEAYHLDIKQGNHHVRATAKMLQAVPINQVVSNQNEGNVEIYFDDDANTDDYYFVKFIENNNTSSFYPQYQYFADYELYDQQNRKASLYIYTGQPGTIYLYHITKQMYDYFKILRNVGDMNFGDGPFSTSVPGNPESNIEGGIGYFMVAPVSEKNVN